MQISFRPIGAAHTDETTLPRHWTVSEVEGTLVINRDYVEGLADITAGQRIVVLFHFHKSAPFSPDLLKQTPPHRAQPMGVFSICSPRRPNAIGMSVLEVLDIRRNVIHVRGMDMLDGTPLIDIKPYVDGGDNLPSKQ